jgi:hypothetical protein
MNGLPHRPHGIGEETTTPKVLQLLNEWNRLVSTVTSGLPVTREQSRVVAQFENVDLMRLARQLSQVVNVEQFLSWLGLNMATGFPPI